MSSTEPTQSFTLTEGQLITLRFVIERGFLEFLEYARDSTRPPGDFERNYVDAFMELCEVFGVDIPEVPEK
jgi:hypothetical protein